MKKNTLHDKKLSEQTVLRVLTKYMKDTYGKGPSDIIVKINQHQIHIFAKGFILKSMKVILDDPENYPNVQEIYQRIYNKLRDDGLKQIGEALGAKVDISDIQVDFYNDECNAILTISQND